jgi:type IV pilus assembly protein PilF
MKRLWMMVLLFALLPITSACVSQSQKDKEAEQENKRDPASADINADLGMGYMRQGDYKMAMEKLLKALAYDPELPKAHYYIAELYRRLGQMDMAKHHYEEAYRLDPKNPTLHNNYGTFLCSIGEYEKADKFLQLAINNKLYQGRVRAMENAGVCAYLARDLDKAENYLRMALEINPKLPIALYQMTVVQFEKKDYLRARAYLQRFEEVGQLNAEALWIGIRIEYYLGDKEAMQRYVKMLGSQFPASEQWRKYEEHQW